MGDTRIKVESETAISHNPARVLVYDENEVLISEITAIIVLERGADGGRYPCIKLIQKDIKKT